MLKLNLNILQNYLLAILLILCQAACKEPYNPAVDTQTGAIVVEGRITNLKESYKVKISSAIAFDSLAGFSGILGALVSIKDDAGNIYIMHENKYQQIYYSDPSEFIALQGRSYTLHIEMPGGDIYESSAQKLTEPVTIDSIYGTVTKKQYLYKNQLGDQTTKMASGSETFVDLSYNSDSISQFRFENTLMKCYTYWLWYTPEMKAAGVAFPPPNPCTGTVCPYVIYNWKKFSLNSSIILSNSTNHMVSNRMKNNTVCFFPFENDFYPILQKVDSCTLDKFDARVCTTIKGPSTLEGDVLQTRIYSLNQEAAVYYTQINAQLSSEGRLFDPIAVQLQGNMKCINNPGKIVLGLFELSSCITRSYKLNFNYLNGSTTYHPVADISGIPEVGANKSYPEFWQAIFFY